MPKITIDGKEFQAKDGETILQAAERNGIYIPRYCYHPSLSVAGNCRMCLVEVEKMPKLQTACSTVVSEGMAVFTLTEKVKKARKDVLEFLLINHPLDCPICDQAGECHLQDYYMDYGLHKSRMRPEEKNRRPKRRDFGEHLVLDNERCILCTRCVRFCEEITKTEELFVSGRSDRSFIDIKPGEKIKNDYSLNLAELCPVGAFTSRDFRFRQRVWFLKTTRSVCLGCATGCGIKVQHNGNTIYRIIPDPNEHTNTWLCDAGRMTCKPVHSANRLKKALINGEPPARDENSSLKAFELLNACMEKNGKDSVAVILSGRLSAEDNLALLHFARKTLGTGNIFAEEGPEQKIKDGILLNSDPLPNMRVVSHLRKKYGLKELQGAELSGIKFIVAFEKEAGRYFPKIPGLIFSTEKSERPGALLPVKTYFEQEATFINWQGYMRKTAMAVEADKGVPELWKTLAGISSYFSVYLPFSELKDFEKLISEEKFEVRE